MSVCLFVCLFVFAFQTGSTLAADPIYLFLGIDSSSLTDVQQRCFALAIKFPLLSARLLLQRVSKLVCSPISKDSDSSIPQPAFGACLSYKQVSEAMIAFHQVMTFETLMLPDFKSSSDMFASNLFLRRLFARFFNQTKDQHQIRLPSFPEVRVAGPKDMLVKLLSFFDWGFGIEYEFQKGNTTFPLVHGAVPSNLPTNIFSMSYLDLV